MTGGYLWKILFARGQSFLFIHHRQSYVEINTASSEYQLYMMSIQRLEPRCGSM